MSRRLLKTANGLGLYEITEMGMTWQEWLRLPSRDTTDPALRLEAEATPKAPRLPGGPVGWRVLQRARTHRSG